MGNQSQRCNRITPVQQKLHWLPVRRLWISRQPPSSTCHCPAWLQPIRRLSVGLQRRSLMETDVLQLQVRSCGTAFRLICDKLTLTFNDFTCNGYKLTKDIFCSSPGERAYSATLTPSWCGWGLAAPSLIGATELTMS